jgi:hypothetical protein
MNPQLIMLALGGGAILWWLSQKTPATTTPATPGTGTPATTTLATSSTQTPANPPVQAPPVQQPPVTPPAAPPTPSMTIAEAFAKMLEAEAQDSTLTQFAPGIPLATFSQHNWYLNSVTGNTNPLPDHWTVSGGLPDPNTPMPIAQYRSLIEPWLRANRGMSGLGQPRRLWPGYVGPGGWRA